MTARAAATQAAAATAAAAAVGRRGGDEARGHSSGRGGGSGRHHYGNRGGEEKAKRKERENKRGGEVVWAGGQERKGRGPGKAIPTPLPPQKCKATAGLPLGGGSEGTGKTLPECTAPASSNSTF